MLYMYRSCLDVLDSVVGCERAVTRPLQSSTECHRRPPGGALQRSDVVEMGLALPNCSG